MHYIINWFDEDVKNMMAQNKSTTKEKRTQAKEKHTKQINLEQLMQTKDFKIGLKIYNYLKDFNEPDIIKFFTRHGATVNNGIIQSEQYRKYKLVKDNYETEPKLHNIACDNLTENKSEQHLGFYAEEVYFYLKGRTPKEKLNFNLQACTKLFGPHFTKADYDNYCDQLNDFIQKIEPQYPMFFIEDMGEYEETLFNL